MFNPWPIHDRVMVNMLDGSAMAGVLIARKGPLIVLAHADLFQPGEATPTAMDGLVYIERTQIAFIQAMPAKGG